MHSKYDLTLLLFGASVFSCAATIAQAQTTTETVETSLEEIVVTAERREIDLQNIAIAISTVDGDDLRTRGQSDLVTAMREVPGVSARDEATQASTFVIRGIAPAQFTDPTVNISIDNVYQQYGGSSPSFDLERIEVLKGPQGTLFGRNATGGAVNIVTAAPGDVLGGFATLQAGNYDAMRGEGALDLPLGDVLQTRTAVLYSKRDGYLSNGNQDEDIFAVREKVRWLVNDDLNLLLTGEYAEFGGNGTGVVAAPLSARDDAWSTPNGPSAQDVTKASGNLLVDWDLGWSTLFFQSSYEDYRPHTDQNLQNPADGYTVGKLIYKTHTDELRFASPQQSTLIWQAGLYYLRTEAANLAFASPLLTAGTHVPTNTESVSDRESKAVFGQMTFPVTDALRLTGGLRYTEDTAERGTKVYDATTRALVTTVNQSPRSYSALTYKAGLEFDAAENSMLYVDVSKGYKAGGLNEPGSNPETYEPEYNLAYEIGSKNRFADDTVELNVDAYYYDYTDMQLVALGSPSIYTAPFPTTPVLNAGKAEIYGAEAALQWLVTPADRVSTTVAYNHARFEEFAFYSLNVSIGPSGPVLTPVVTDLSGTAVPNAPETTATLSYEHTFTFSGGSELKAEGNVFHASGHDVELSPFAADRRQDAYERYNARLLYTPAEGNWTVGAYGNNLSNEAVRTRTFNPNPTVTNLYIGAPRTFGATFGVKF